MVYGYGSSGSTDDVLSRIATIGDGMDTLAAYEYLGVGTIVSEDYAQPEVKLDYTAGNFSALDRFGRVLDQAWGNYGSSPGTLDEYNYAFDRAGNRTQRLNAMEAALDQLYEYDGLNQLVSAERGNGYTQDWELDGLGSWSSFDDDGTVQTRTTNDANEITATTGLATPDYDRSGNMIGTPKPGDPANAWDVKYDAWNRVVEVTDGVTTVTYEYDANGRRIQRTAGGTAEHFYYDGDQVVEIREPDGVGGLQPKTQYVWSLSYIDSPALRDSFTAGTLVPADRLYYLVDANHNVTAVVDINGNVVERYDYDPYGKATVYDDAWANPTTVSAVGNTLLFAGQKIDEITYLQYSRARWYNSAVGAFISRDPIGFDGGDANVYRYVCNDPNNATDPSGLRGPTLAPRPTVRPSIRPTQPNGSTGGGPLQSPLQTPGPAPYAQELGSINSLDAAIGASRALNQANAANAAREAGNQRLGTWANAARNAGVPEDYIRRVVAQANEPRLSAPGVKLPDPVDEAVKKLDDAISNGGKPPIPPKAPGGLDDEEPEEPYKENTSGSGPKKSPNFLPPTNPPQEVPTELPPGHSVRPMPPAPGYPHGYWVQTNQYGQPVNPATGRPPANVSRPEARAQTHVPLPPPGGH